MRKDWTWPQSLSKCCEHVGCGRQYCVRAFRQTVCGMSKARTPRAMHIALRQHLTPWGAPAAPLRDIVFSSWMTLREIRTAAERRTARSAVRGDGGALSAVRGDGGALLAMARRDSPRPQSFNREFVLKKNATTFQESGRVSGACTAFRVGKRGLARSERIKLRETSRSRTTRTTPVSKYSQRPRHVSSERHEFAVSSRQDASLLHSTCCRSSLVSHLPWTSTF